MTQQKKKYTTFYQVMLILSTIGTAFAVLGLTGIPQTIQDFGSMPVFSIASLLEYGATIVSVVALILLWQKRREGYLLKIGSYIALIVINIISLFSIGPFIDESVRKIIFDMTLKPDEIDIIRTLFTAGVYAAFAVSIATVIIFMLLWMKAWKKQQAHDK
jgi:hypothetical protein